MMVYDKIKVRSEQVAKPDSDLQSFGSKFSSMGIPLLCCAACVDRADFEGLRSSTFQVIAENKGKSECLWR